MITFFQFLNESEERIAFIKKQHPDVPDHRIEHFASKDPTPNKQYTQWMVQHYKKGNLSPMEDIGNSLSLYHQGKHLLEPQHRDINRLTPDNIHSLAVHVKDLLAKKDNAKKLKNDIETHYSQNGLTVASPKTWEAAKSMANLPKGHSSGLNKCTWCTSGSSSDSHFKNYTSNYGFRHTDDGKEGKLFIIRTPDDRRYQFHAPSGEFRDEHDNTVNGKDFAIKYPEIKNVQALKGHGLASLPFLHPHEVGDMVKGAIKRNNPEELDTLARRGFGHDQLRHANSWRVRATVADHTENPSFLHELAHDAEVPVRRVVSQNIHATKETIQHLAKDNDASVRRSVADNTIHHDILHQLARDGSDNVRRGVASRLVDSVNDYLVHDPDPSVREIVASGGHEKHLDHLVNDESAWVRRKVAEVGLPRHHQQLVKDPDAAVRSKVIYNTSDKDTLMHAAQHEPSDELRKVAQKSLRIKHNINMRGPKDQEGTESHLKDLHATAVRVAQFAKSPRRDEQAVAPIAKRHVDEVMREHFPHLHDVNIHQTDLPNLIRLHRERTKGQ